ncbi:MAG TPA: HEAT repeat domain-containing protein [Archangium sp.]|nr:HEAT repeat domain-containing protein [Archangium sp.]
MNERRTRDDIAVVALGLCTPLGLTAHASLLEMGAGTVRFLMTDVADRDGDPLRASVLTLLDPILSRTERMRALAVTALLDCHERLVALGPAPVPLVLALPEREHGARYDPSLLVASLVEAAMPVRLQCPGDQVLPEGRAGFFVAVQRALTLLGTGRVAGVLVGAVDSLCDRESLVQMEAKGRCLTSRTRDGTLPGEGAGFVLLTTSAVVEQRKWTPLGWLDGVAITQEPHHFHQGEPNLAEGLTKAFRQLIALVQVGTGRVERVLSCQTGEAFWNREFAHAYLRSAELMPEPLRLELLASSLGDSGAAAGAIQLGHALEAPSGARALIYGCSDGGRIGACIAEAAGRNPVHAPLPATTRRAPGFAPLLEHPEAEGFFRDFQEQHLSELEFLIGQRQLRLSNPEHPWPRLLELETRVAAHVRALRTTENTVPKLLAEVLSSEEPDFVRAVIHALAARDPASVGSTGVFDAMEQASDALLPIFHEALVWVPPSHVAAGLLKLLGSSRPTVVAMAARLLGHHRIGDGARLSLLLQAPHPEVRAAAAAAVARLGYRDALPELEQIVTRAPPIESAELLVSSLHLGSRRSMEYLYQTCRITTGAPPEFLHLLAMTGRTQALPLLVPHNRELGLTVASLESLGILGLPETVPLLLEHLSTDVPPVRLAAASALLLITGAPLSQKVRLWSPMDEEGDEPNGPEVNQPLTEPKAWHEWWRAHRARLSGPGRLRHGVPFTPDTCVDEIAAQHSSRQTRTRAAQELGILTGKAIDFEPDWPVDRQQRAIERLRKTRAR